MGEMLGEAGRPPRLARVGEGGDGRGWAGIVEKEYKGGEIL
jgi:hypothetical protein